MGPGKVGVGRAEAGGVVREGLRDQRSKACL